LQDLEMSELDAAGQLAQCRAELEATRKELQSFSYSISHDLRAPLRAIDGFSRILQEDYSQSLDPEGQKFLGFVLANAQHLSRLIEDLLIYYRLGQHPMQRGKVDMADLFRSITTEFRAIDPSRTVAIQIADLPFAEGDPALLRQAVTQLVSNAFKFSRRRPDARVEVGYQKSGEQTVYWIRDNGIGFEMQYAPKLFQVFQKLHTGDEFEGNGIGLAMTHRIIMRHGGKIWAESKPGEGTTLFFTLASE
jgi:light-regulated signal transduction histidine kinase (bacteriophytochrome)